MYYCLMKFTLSFQFTQFQEKHGGQKASLSPFFVLPPFLSFLENMSRCLLFTPLFSSTLVQ